MKWLPQLGSIVTAKAPQHIEQIRYDHWLVKQRRFCTVVGSDR